MHPNAPGPEARRRVSLGRLTVTRPTTNEEIGDAVMLHDPSRLTDGIEASDDPVLAGRRGIYEVSIANRTGGWKGRQHRFGAPAGCPFRGAAKAWRDSEGLVAGEGDAVEVAGLVVALEALGLVWRVKAVDLAVDDPLMARGCHKWGTRLWLGWV